MSAPPIDEAAPAARPADTADDARARRRAPSTLAVAWRLARKDLAIEYRTRSAFFASLTFSIIGVAIFYFVWDPTAVRAIDVAPGVLWTIFAFASLLGLHRAFAIELQTRAMDALLLAPVSREALFLGKAIANLVYVSAVLAITIPVAVLFYNLPIGTGLVVLAGIGVLAAIGMVSVGTLFSSMTVHTRFAELLLPMLALPFFIPVVVPAAQASARLLLGRPVSEVADWLQLLAAFDVIFFTACLLLFPLTIED
ncbi:MAG: heme exporter protein CcmB [Gemmatimonadaceae bacterium]|nr:heme exporter protein CcmB [Gemmatimonadaceae bacterium]